MLLFGLFATLFVQARDVIPFNDKWAFRSSSGWKEVPTTKSALTDPVLLSSFFNGNWREVNIPHTWNANDMQLHQNAFYQGDAYYRKTFVPDASWKDKRVFIRFEGVGSVADIYINQKPAKYEKKGNNYNFSPDQAKGDYSFVGSHKGGYSAFTLELTKVLKFGVENEILVKVNNEPRTDVIPINHILFGVYGGIYRPVELIVTEQVNIAVTDYASSGVYISQENVTSKSADVNVKVKIENKNHDPQSVNIVNTIYTMEGKQMMTESIPYTILPQGRQFIEQKFNIKKPRLWQGLEDPYLYKVVSQIVQNGIIIDEVVQPLGLRHIEIKAGDGLYLNGKKTPMYGVCRHQDWLGKGSALTNKEHDTDLDIIKEIGATTIRLAHYQQSDYMYSRCDSIGFLVWAEIPFVNRVSGQEADNAKQQLTELIRQSYNHPSIYVWGLHNEVYSPQAYTVELTTTLNDLAKSEDPYRYTVSVNGTNRPDQGVNHNADMLGINHYFGWYNGTINDFEPWLKQTSEKFKNYNILFSEYGAEINIDQQKEVVTDVGNAWGGMKADFNETFATKFHEVHWSAIERNPFLIASYIWNTFDFATPMTSQGGVEARNMKGLVTFDRKIKKDPFYWYKANWSKEPVLYITQRRVVNRENEYTPVAVYSNIGTPQLFVNGVEIKDFSKGATDVHYIFNNVQLKEGENIVEVKATIADGKTYEDKIAWNYSATNKRNVDQTQPVENKKEHIGL